MRAVRIVTLAVLALALGIAASGCASSGSSSLTEDVRDVPDGMPAMYEFYTDT